MSWGHAAGAPEQTPFVWERVGLSQQHGPEPRWCGHDRPRCDPHQAAQEVGWDTAQHARAQHEASLRACISPHGAGKTEMGWRRVGSHHRALGWGLSQHRAPSPAREDWALPAQPGPMAGPPAMAAGPVLPAGQERAGAGRVLPQHRLVVAGGGGGTPAPMGAGTASCTVLDGSSECTVLSPQPHIGCNERSVLSPAPGGCSEFCVLSTRSPFFPLPTRTRTTCFSSSSVEGNLSSALPSPGPPLLVGNGGESGEESWGGVLQGDPPGGTAKPLVLTRTGG